MTLLVSLGGDVDVNPGTNRRQNKALSICHWNFSSIPAHNLARLDLLQAYVTFHKFNIICFTERYLDSSIISKIKRGGVCVYYKTFLPLRVYDISLLH